MSRWWASCGIPLVEGPIAKRAGRGPGPRDVVEILSVDGVFRDTLDDAALVLRVSPRLFARHEARAERDTLNAQADCPGDASAVADPAGCKRRKRRDGGHDGREKLPDRARTSNVPARLHTL